MQEQEFKTWGLRNKPVAIKMTNGDLYRGKLKFTFSNWWVFDPIRDGSGDDPVQIIINLINVSCVYMLDAELM